MMVKNMTDNYYQQLGKYKEQLHEKMLKNMEVE